MKWKGQVNALFMNISLNDASAVNDDDDIEILELSVLPPSYTSNPDTTCIKDIFAAMNTCADLHPDPDDSDADEEDDSAPGATGWITTDNMDEYLDEDGNFLGQVIGGELGPGAGTVRERDDDEEERPNGVNGTNGDAKWQRTD
jgi:nucleotide-sensitive chloride channel 1A